MGVIPSGTETYINWGAREAAANEALVKLFMTLMARREENASNNQMRRELHYDTQAGADRRLGQTLDQRDRGDRLRYPQQQQRGPSPLSGGAAGYGNPPQAAAAAPAGAIPGATVAPPPPSTSSFQKTSQADILPMVLAKLRSAGREAGGDAQQQPRGDTSDEESAAAFASQFASPNTSDIGAGQVAQVGAPAGTIPKPDKNEIRPKAKVGSDPAVLPKQDQPQNPRAKPKASAMYAEIKPDILDHFAKIEDKYGLPRGLLITQIGTENGGGYSYGRTGKAEGWFQFTDQLIRDMKINPADRSNVYKMADHAARNMRNNARVLEEVSDIPGKPGTKIVLGSTIKDIPYWMMLHQFGPGDGPRFIVALKNDPTRSVTSLMKKQVDANGKTIDPSETLIKNGLDHRGNIGQFFQNYQARINPWLVEGVKIQTDRTPEVAQGGQVKPQSGDQPGVVKTTDISTKPQPTERPPAPRINDRRLDGVAPRVREWIERVKEKYPNVQITSGYRDPVHNEKVGGATDSQHIHRRALDLDLSKLPDNEKQDVLNWGRAAGAGAIGNYGGSNIHIDFRHGTGTVWGPSRSKDSLGQTPRWFQEIAREHQRGDKPRMALYPRTTEQPNSAYAGGEKPADPTPMQVSGIPGVPIDKTTKGTDPEPKNIPGELPMGKSDLFGKGTMNKDNFKPGGIPYDKLMSPEYSGAPPNPPPLPKIPTTPITRGAPPTAPVDAQITRGAPPTAPPPDITRGQPPTAPPTEDTPSSGQPPATPTVPEAAVAKPAEPPPPPVAQPPVPQKKGVFGRLSFAGPQQQEVGTPPTPTTPPEPPRAPDENISIIEALKRTGGKIADVLTTKPPIIDALKKDVQDVGKGKIAQAIFGQQPNVPPPITPVAPADPAPSPYQLNGPEGAITGSGLDVGAAVDWLANKFKSQKVQQKLAPGPRVIKSVPITNQPPMPKYDKLYIEPKSQNGPAMPVPPAGVLPNINPAGSGGGGGGAVGTIIEKATPNSPGTKIGPNGTIIYYDYEEGDRGAATPPPDLPPPDVEEELTAAED